MVFLEFTEHTDNRPLLINIEYVSSIEDMDGVTCIEASGFSHYVKESYSEIVAFMRDNECGVF